MKMKKHHKARWLKLADLLDTVDPEHFDMEEIAYSGFERPKKDWSCGTAACALGYAATIPSFKKAGLKLCYEFDVYGYTNNYWVELGHDDDMRSIVNEFFGEYYDGFNADTEWLFHPNSGHKTPKQVAANIRKFVVDVEAREEPKPDTYRDFLK